MKIAITGASGFIGKELTEELSQREDIQLVLLSRGTKNEEVASTCQWRTTDYSVDSLRECFHGTDAVIHLAGVRGTENDPEKFADNLVMTGNLLKAMLSEGTSRIVFASSVSVYDGNDHVPWKEEDSAQGYNAYGKSKSDCENAIISCCEKSHITYGIARIAQVLGEGEKRRGMMNTFIDTARKKETLKVMGKSVIKRQYIYVKDLVKVLTLMTTYEGSGGSNLTLNVGMPHAYSNLEIARIVNEVYENTTLIDYDDSYPETGRGFYMDITRLRNELNYKPLDMREALADNRRTKK